MQTRRHQTALITGASRGLGSAFARALPDANLILSGRSAGDLETLATELDEGNRTVTVCIGDISENAVRARLIELGEENQIDLLINNAGLGEFGAFLESNPKRTELSVDVNIQAPLSLSRALLPGMVSRARSGGARCGLIHVSSSAAFVPVPDFAVYSASKAFMLSWTEALTAELSHDPIDVLAFCPGAIDTEFGGAAGYSGRIPGAMPASFAANAALRALGRINTLALDQLGAIPLSAVALGRSAFANILRAGLRTSR